MYQLVLQWPTGSVVDYDDLIEMEDRLLTELGSVGGDVDGHDMGSGQMNIFIFTEQPHQTFNAAARCLAGEAHWSEVRAAYRSTDSDAYTIVWPEGLHEFAVL